MGVLSQLLDTKVVAIVRGANPGDVLSVAQALYDGGVRAMEITLNSPSALSVIEELAVKMGNSMVIGAGTVLDPVNAKAAIDAGAKFIISPITDADIIRTTRHYDAVSIPGAFTPTEIMAAYGHGGDIIKVFPAFSVIRCRYSSVTLLLVSTSEVPIPNATAPASRNAFIFSRLMPPVGISGICGNGARTSFI